MFAASMEEVVAAATGLFFVVVRVDNFTLGIVSVKMTVSAYNYAFSIF